MPPLPQHRGERAAGPAPTRTAGVGSARGPRLRPRSAQPGRRERRHRSCVGRVDLLPRHLLLCPVRPLRLSLVSLVSRHPRRIRRTRSHGGVEESGKVERGRAPAREGVDPSAQRPLLVLEHGVDPVQIRASHGEGLFASQAAEIEHQHAAVGPDPEPAAPWRPEHPAALVERRDEGVELLPCPGLSHPLSRRGCTAVGGASSAASRERRGVLADVPVLLYADHVRRGADPGDLERGEQLHLRGDGLPPFRAPPAHPQRVHPPRRSEALLLAPGPVLGATVPAGAGGSRPLPARAVAARTVDRRAQDEPVAPSAPGVLPLIHGHSEPHRDAHRRRPSTTRRSRQE